MNDSYESEEDDGLGNLERVKMELTDPDVLARLKRQGLDDRDDIEHEIKTADARSQFVAAVQR